MKNLSAKSKIIILFAILAVVTAASVAGCGDSTSEPGAPDSAVSDTSVNADGSNSSEVSDITDAPESSDADASTDLSNESELSSSEPSEDISTESSEPSADPSDDSTEEPSDDSSEPSVDPSEDPSEPEEPSVDPSDDPSEPSVDPSRDPSDDSSDESSDDSSVSSDTEPEVLGSGTADDPYLVIPSDMKVTTVTVPAGESVFYGIYRVGGTIMSIDDAEVYVVYNKTEYVANNNGLSFQIGEAMPNDVIIFEIGNFGMSDISYEITFANPTGSFANPTAIDNISDDYSISLGEGASTGYYYKYVAENNGTLRFAMTASTDSVMLVTNNRNSAQRTTEADGSTDENGVMYVEIAVEAGDEIIINVGSKPVRGKYPAVEISWSAEYK